MWRADFMLTALPYPLILLIMQHTEKSMVHIGQVISVLGSTSEARTVARWMAASEVVPNSAAGRDGVGRADLSRRDVAMIVLGMAAPVARRAPEYASELAQLVGDGDGRTLVDVLADALSDHEQLKVSNVWLPSYEGGSRHDVTLRVHTDEGFREQRFIDTRSPAELGQVLIGKTEDTEVYIDAVRAPLLARYQYVQGRLLVRLAMLFVEREGATMPVAVEKDAAA